MLVAYHADDEITKALLMVLIPGALALLVLCGVLAARLRQPDLDGAPRLATVALVVAALAAPLAGLYWTVAWPLVFAAVALAVAAVARVPRVGGKRRALGALALGGAAAVQFVAIVAACAATDACFH